MAINKRSVWITSTFILVGALGVSQDTASVFAQGASKPGPDALKRRAPQLPIPKPVLPKPPVLPAKPGKPPTALPVSEPLVQPRTSGLDRWVESTPDALLSAAVRRVEANADDAVAGLLLAASMQEFASPGETLKALNAIARGKTSAAVDAAGLVAALTPAPFGKTWTGWAYAPLDVADDANGFVRAVTVFGPFGDTGGGLPLHEGPE
jgi:hypothetical protein